MSLDFNIKTLIFTIVIGHLFSGILGIAYMVQHKKDSSLYIFLFARLFDTFAWAVLGLRGIINSSISISMGDSFLIIAHTTQIIAFLIIKKRYNKLIRQAYFTAAAISIVMIHTKFNKKWFNHSIVDRGIHTQGMVISETYFYFLQTREVG